MNINQDDSLPIGFGMALAMNMEAMDHFSHLSDSQKEEVINKAKSVQSKSEMQKIVNELSSGRAY